MNKNNQRLSSNLYIYYYSHICFDNPVSFYFLWLLWLHKAKTLERFSWWNLKFGENKFVNISSKLTKATTKLMPKCQNVPCTISNFSYKNQNLPVQRFLYFLNLLFDNIWFDKYMLLNILDYREIIIEIHLRWVFVKHLIKNKGTISKCFTEIRPFEKSFMYMRNRSGPKIDPWRTPESMVFQDEHWLSSITLSFLLSRL